MQFVENVRANWQEGYRFIMTMPDPNTARTTQERIQELKCELLEHPPYSPDLAPRDFHLFRPLKNHLGDKRFAGDEEVETEVRKWLRQQSGDFHTAGFDALVKRRDKCINVGVGYVERENLFPRFEYHMFYVLYPFWPIY
jgi:hypothetical protein